MPISLGIGTAVTRGGGLYGPPPQLDLNFASLLSLTPSVGPTPSYTRASTGTYFDASGVLTTAAINGPRFDHVYNGVFWVSKGLLVEEARTNLETYSEDFSNAVWAKENATITTNQLSAPNNNTTADLVLETSANGSHGFYRNDGSLASHTFSVFLKPAGRDKVKIYRGGVPADSVVFDLVTLLASSVGANVSGYSIFPVGGGWVRCSVTNNVASVEQYVYFLDSSGSVAYTGDITKGVYAWGAQLEAGAFPTSYIPTTTAAVTRSADICQISGTDFSGFWNQTEGSVVLSYDMILATLVATTQRVFTAWNAGFSSGLVIYDDSSGCNVEVNPGASFAFGSSVSPTNVALGYKVNDFATGRNGGAVLTDTSGAGPSGLNAMYIGNNIGNGSNMHNGHIARLRYFNTRLINSQLVALST